MQSLIGNYLGESRPFARRSNGWKGSTWRRIIGLHFPQSSRTFFPNPVQFTSIYWPGRRRQRDRPSSSPGAQLGWFRHLSSVPGRMSLVPSFFGRRRGGAFDPFSLDLWESPFQGFPFDSSLASSSAFSCACVDWKETPQAHVFKADLPGLRKEEVKVEVEDDRILQISGERSVEKEERNDTWHRVERSSGKFVRRFRLPENAKVDQVRAAMENGVLTVTVPKLEPKKSNVKAIEISG